MKNKQSSELIEIKERNSLIKDEASLLISQAIDKGVDVATLEKLLVLRSELKKERAKEEYDRAMASFQAKCPIIEKRKQGYNYKYAPLESIVEQVKELLSENGFSYTFDTQEADNAVIIICNVKHIAGHAEVSKATITKETTTKMNASQQSGAAMTYGKRYAFVNAFGILTGDEDTDASSTTTPQKSYTDAQSNPMTPRQMAEEKERRAYTDDDGVTHEPYQSKPANVVYATEKQIAFIKKLLAQKGWTEKEVFIKYKVKSLPELLLINAKQIIDNLLKLPNKENEESEADQIVNDASEAGL